MRPIQLMKIYLNGILVVEGKEDSSYLSNYIESEIVVVNGFELSSDTISYLKDKHVIALLDPDESGEKIRAILNQKISNISNVCVSIDKCTRGIKNGVAECQIDEILSQLKKFAIDNPNLSSDIKQSDLYNLGLYFDKDLRLFVCKKLNLGICNGKLLLKRLNLNAISLAKLCEIIEEYKNGNK